MTLHLLPTRTAGAAENMALDFLLLQRYPDVAAVRFRHYEWRAPAFTFGLSQPLGFVRAQLPAGPFDLCRRPTGGGVVDHREDWTYSLIIPRGHPLEGERATHSYRVVHTCLAGALRALGQPVVLKVQHDHDRSATLAPGVCFQRPEAFDVLHEQTGAKVAGAAQKRNKHGLLLQGSIWKPSAGPVDWDAFAEKFSTGLAAALGAEPQPVPWPEFADGEVEALIEHYSSPGWMEYR